ncbi:MAG: TVP38/TMEM64 family protein [Nitrospinae bacterium]|nr:TVP38/TMEM64 family protein [Nitrospinota bacterium]
MNRHAVTLLKGFFALLLLAAGALVYWEYRTEGLTPGHLARQVREFGAWGPLIFAAAYALLAGAGFPAVILTTLGALVFGKWLGTGLNLIGAMAGASIAFALSRFLLKDFFERRVFGDKQWYVRFNDGVRENGFNYLLFIRLIPLFPFNGVNFAAGISRLRYRHFFFGTLLGIAPHTFVFTNAVAELGESAARGFHVTPGLVGALTLLALFAIAPLLVKKVIERRRGSAPQRKG